MSVDRESLSEQMRDDLRAETEASVKAGHIRGAFKARLGLGMCGARLFEEDAESAYDNLNIYGGVIFDTLCVASRVTALLPATFAGARASVQKARQ